MILTNAALILLDGKGHTAQGRGIPCVDDAVDRFYLAGRRTPSIECEQYLFLYLFIEIELLLGIASGITSAYER